MQMIKDGEATNGMYVNFMGDKCFIFLLDKITKANGCWPSVVPCNRYTAIASGKVDKRIIEIPKKLGKVVQM